VRPDLEELIGDVPAEERERLLRAHEALLEAGPPPDLPAALARPLAPRRSRRRRAVAVAALAAALALASFAGGWLARGGAEFEAVRVVDMRGTSFAPEARAEIRIGAADELGNWPMILDVTGLRPLPADGYYVLLLTRGGEPVAYCGSFRVGEGGSATVRFGASYRLARFDGWIVRPWVQEADELNEITALTS
jgi:hypothetical protein